MPISNHRSFQLQQMPVGILWGIRPNFFGLSPCVRQVAYALRTRPPVAGKSTEVLYPMPLDLHVLGLPLAFILSQDQTLHCKKNVSLNILAILKGILKIITVSFETSKNKL